MLKLKKRRQTVERDDEVNLESDEEVSECENGIESESGDENEVDLKDDESEAENGVESENEGSGEENEQELESEESGDNNEIQSEDEDNAESENEASGDNDNAVSENENSGDEIHQHKQALSKLKHTDPEFFKFLQENDKKLLQFDVSDDEEEDNDNEPHELPSELELASDESDFEDESNVRSEGKITLKLLKKWENAIQVDKTNNTITALMQGFHAALLHVSSSEKNEKTPYIVEGSAAFNGVIQICVLHLGPALKRFLGIPKNARQPAHKFKKFNKIKTILKDYLTDLTKLLSGVTSANIQTVLLKHLHTLTSFLVSFPHVTKLLLKRLISIWGNGEEGVRVVAFLCILRITNSQKSKLLDTVLKSLYMTYIKHSKFVSIGSLAGINFMRRSLIEMFALDANVAYQHAFLYVRQLAIYLRNAITLNKKENIQAVCNWQFINSLKLWGSLVSATHHKPQLNQLIYPVVQVCLGVLKLAPTTQYFPLRFHVIKVLIEVSHETGCFIPILPFILEILTTYDFDKKHQKVSMKPMHFTCLLRVSKSQMSENGFKDTLIDNIYGLLLEYLSNNSQSISFPDLSFLCVTQMKLFVKKCNHVKYKRKIKQLLEKVEQNAQFIESERNKVSLAITDLKKIEGWEAQIRIKGTPVGSFYESWSKLHTLKTNKQLTNNEELGEYNLPQIKKQTGKVKRSEGPVELFPSDSEDEEVGTKKRKRGKRGGKSANKKLREDDVEEVEDTGEKDLVEDLQINDW